jgi:hypothetical protein
MFAAENVFLLEGTRRHIEKCRCAFHIGFGQIDETALGATFGAARLAFKAQA